MAAVCSNRFLKLGLAAIPVDVVAAVKSDQGPRMHTYCNVDEKGKAHDPAQVTQTYNCPICSRADKPAGFVKGTEGVAGEIKLASDVDLEELANAVDDDLKTTIAITTHNAADVLSATVPSGKYYYLRPSKGCPLDFYASFAAMVAQTTDIAFCTMFAVRTAPAMYRLGAHNGVLVLDGLAWPDEVHEAPSVPQTFDQKQVDQMAVFVDMLKAPFDPATFKDTRKEVFENFVATANGVPATPTAVKVKAASTSLMDLLAASVAVAAPKKAVARKPKAKAS